MRDVSTADCTLQADPPRAPGGSPVGVSHPKTIKSFVRRAGRTPTGQAKACVALGPRFVLPYQAARLAATAVVG
ncbi:MAG: tRNA (guanosine(46)-N7)-methyltransferase TrmB, partial [Acidovorax sp.]